MRTLEGIPINASTIANCYKMFYPDSYKMLQDSNFVHYLHLWAIRVSTCDTSLPDDLIGGIRISAWNLLDITVSNGSTDPSPKYVKTPVDRDAKIKGGTAFIIEGQYAYRYNGKRHKKWKPYPSFCPISRVPVYRWNASMADVKSYKDGKKPLSSSFDAALKSGAIIKSFSSDVCIHRAFDKSRFWADSAGCQILTDYDSLNTLGTWADEHRAKGYPNSFIFTLFNKSQFLSANGKRPPAQQPLYANSAALANNPNIVGVNLFKMLQSRK